MANVGEDLYLRLLNNNPWLRIQEVIGLAATWPSYVRKSFWCGTLGYNSRLIIATFSYGNGLNIDILCDFLQRHNPAWTLAKERKIRDLYELWDDSEINRARRSYFDLNRRRVLDLNGEVYEAGNGNVNYYMNRYYHRLFIPYCDVPLNAL